MVADFHSVAFDIASHAQVRVVRAVPFDMTGLPAAIAGLVVHWAASTLAWRMSRFVTFVADFLFHRPGAIVRVVLSPAPPARRPG